MKSVGAAFFDYWTLQSTWVTVGFILVLGLFTAFYTFFKRKEERTHPIYWVGFALAFVVDIPLSFWSYQGLHIVNLAMIGLMLFGLHYRQRWFVSFPVMASFYCFHSLGIDVLVALHPTWAWFSGAGTEAHILDITRQTYWFEGIGGAGFQDGLFINLIFILLYGKLFWEEEPSAALNSTLEAAASS